MTRARLDVPAVWWGVFMAWAAASLALIISTLEDEFEVVPMLFSDLILWPNSMTLGAFLATSAMLAFCSSPTSRGFVAATFIGSALGLCSLWITTEFEFLLCASSTVALAVMGARCLALRRPPSTIQAMALAIYVLYGGSVYLGHVLFLFPFFDEINDQRSAAVTEIVARDDPLAAPECRTAFFSCFAFDADGDRMGFSDLHWSYLAEVHSSRPLNPVALEFPMQDALNNKSDLVFVGMRNVGGQTAVVVSLPGHLMEWRLLVAKYFIATSSYTFLFLYAVLFPTALWMQRGGSRQRT